MILPILYENVNSPVKGQSIFGADRLTIVCKWMGAWTNSSQNSLTKSGKFSSSS